MTQLLVLQFLLFSSVIFQCLESRITGCKFEKHLTASSINGEEQIELLKGKRFKVSDGDYSYEIGFCTNAVDIEGNRFDGAGVVQFHKNLDESNADEYHVIGRIDHADIIAGPGWVMLEYNAGDPYTSHCPNDKGRQARIMFICKMNATEEQPVILEEQNNKTDSCYYLFEFSTSKVCPKQAIVKTSLSVGSIVLIVFFSLLSVYLIAGFLYSRFVLHAKGLEQIPNLSFWKDFGNLQTDGCDLICRSQKAHTSRMYQGLGDDQLEDGDPFSMDDHILPM